MRRSYRVVAVVLALAMICTASLAAAPQISRVTMCVYGGSGLSRGFSWHTAAGLAGSDVQIARPGGDVLNISGRSGKAGSELWHKAEVEKLAPGTSYSYRVGDAAANVWSEWSQFETPAGGAFTFICLTDTQAASLRDAEISANTLAVARRIAPEAGLVIHSGDVVDDGADEKLWQLTLDAARNSLMGIAIAPAAGNHERANGDFYRHFNVQTAESSATSTGVYFSFDWGPVHFVTLNTNEPSGDISGLSNDQLEWLKKDIAAALENGALRVVVNLHKGMYSLGPYTADSTNTGKNGRRTKLAPLFSELGVDLVLQGHDHVASRTYPLGGVTYINTRTAGVKSYPVSPDATSEYLKSFDYVGDTPSTYTRYQNFAIINVDALGNMSGKIYEIDHKTDKDSAYIIDSFYLETPASRLPATENTKLGADPMRIFERLLQMKLPFVMPFYGRAAVGFALLFNKH